MMAESETYSRPGEHLRQIREMQGLTLRDAEARSRPPITRTTLSKLETDAHTGFNIARLPSVASAYGITIIELLGIYGINALDESTNPEPLSSEQ